MGVSRIRTDASANSGNFKRAESVAGTSSNE
jgi:hypothetical protein